MTVGDRALDESHAASVLQPAVTSGGMRLLSDSQAEDVVEWREYDGEAAVLAPHGPDGVRAARRWVSERQNHLARRRRAGGERGDGADDDDALAMTVSLQWVADCVKARKRLSPSAHPLYSPCPHRLPLADFRELQICISRYEVASEERRLAIDVIKLLGGRYKDNFKRGRSHLVCAHIAGDKCERAAEWGVPMVTASWLKDCFEKPFASISCVERRRATH